MRQFKIYIGNIPFASDDQDLREFFGQFGEIVGLHRPLDKETGKPKGFAFIEYNSQQDMDTALEADGQDFQGRRLRISQATEKRKTA